MHVKDSFNLEGKVAIVTGGGSGLGLQMATALAEAGANVALASRRVELCEQRAEEMSRLGVKTLGLKMDLTNPGEVNSMVERVVKEMGKVDILVNNSGIGKVVPTLETSLDDWNHVLAVNVTGAFLCCQAAGKYMIKQRRGKIINIASIYGVVGVDKSLYTPSEEEVFEELNYTTSKGALVNLTRDLAVSWARYHINVNAISPGGFVTEADRALREKYGEAMEKKWCARTPLGRMGGDDDLKGTVVYLASDASNYVTGHNLVVDGGWLAW